MKHLLFAFIIIITFSIQSITQIRLEVEGLAQINTLASSGTSLVRADANGILSDFPLGSPGQVLSSSGTSLTWANANHWDRLGNAGSNS